MDKNMITEEAFETTVPAEEAVESKKEEAVEPKKEEKGGEFKFFKCCSASLKRFSIIMFIVNAFIAVSIIGVLAVFLVAEIGTAMLSLLALPLVTLFVILILIARFISAVIYGFAEIVEKNEK